MLASRLLNVYPICWLMNLFRPARRKITENVQHVVWFSGLRGGIAFALALEARLDFACRVPTCWKSENVPTGIGGAYVSLEWKLCKDVPITAEDACDEAYVTWEGQGCWKLDEERNERIDCANEAEGRYQSCESALASAVQSLPWPLPLLRLCGRDRGRCNCRCRCLCGA